MDYQLVSSKDFSGSDYTRTITDSLYNTIADWRFAGEVDSCNYYGKYPIEIDDSWITDHFFYCVSFTSSDGKTARHRITHSVWFTPQTITKIRYGWTTFANGDSSRVRRREFMRVHYGDNTYEYIHGIADRHSLTPIISSATGKWDNVIGISVRLYVSAKAKKRTYDSTSADCRSYGGQIVAYNDLKLSPTILQTSIGNRNLCYTSSDREDLPLKTYDGQAIKALALLEEDAPNPINTEGAGRSGFRIMTQYGIREIVGIGA